MDAGVAFGGAMSHNFNGSGMFRENLFESRHTRGELCFRCGTPLQLFHAIEERFQAEDIVQGSFRLSSGVSAGGRRRAHADREAHASGNGDISKKSGQFLPSIALLATGLLQKQRKSPWESWALREREMLYWAFLFLVIAVIAAIFGFGIAATTAAATGKVLFMLFLTGFVVSLVMHVRRRA
jgi:uncharacterized membrane protein YtjA (UPF0391 family)